MRHCLVHARRNGRDVRGRGMTAAARKCSRCHAATSTFSVAGCCGYSRTGSVSRRGIVDEISPSTHCGRVDQSCPRRSGVDLAIEGDMKPEQVARVAGPAAPQVATASPPLSSSRISRVAHSLPYMVAAAIINRSYSWQHVGPGMHGSAHRRAAGSKVAGDDEASPYASRGGGASRLGCTMAAPSPVLRGAAQLRTAWDRTSGYRGEVSRASRGRVACRSRTSQRAWR